MKACFAEEIATFIRAEGKQIELMPVKSAAVVFILSVATHMAMMIWYSNLGIFELLDAEYYVLVWGIVAVMVPLGALGVSSVFYLGLGLVSELQELPRQLQDFRVREAKCFCCSSDHCHPRLERC